MKVKTIAVLTSGGDAPGMNAAVRAVVRTALFRGLRVLGIRRGYTGMLDNDMFEMDLRSVSDIIHRGGTVLYTARCPEFKTEEGLQKALGICRERGIDGVVVIGGDGSYRGARDLSERGLPCVGLPGTIDNDISSTDYAIGFDTAMNTAMEMIDRLRDTAQSHDRVSVVELMGRNAGDLALHTGIAVGATSILVPEVEFDLETNVLARIRKTQAAGKKHFIISVAEGIGHVEEIAREIERVTGIESRATVLGHVQRGGSPTVRDRVIASRMGYHAVELLAEGIGNRVVGIRNDQIVDQDICAALKEEKKFDFELYRMAHEIAI